MEFRSLSFIMLPTCSDNILKIIWDTVRDLGSLLLLTYSLEKFWFSQVSKRHLIRKNFPIAIRFDEFKLFMYKSWIYLVKEVHTSWSIGFNSYHVIIPKLNTSAEGSSGGKNLPFSEKISGAVYWEVFWYPPTMFLYFLRSWKP